MGTKTARPLIVVFPRKKTPISKTRTKTSFEIKPNTERKLSSPPLLCLVRGRKLTFMASTNPINLLHFLSVFLLFISLAVSQQDPSPPSVYDVLPQFGLPPGLLPDTVTGYTISDDGRFVVELPKPCYIQFDYLVYYDTKITGKLSYGSITDLKGIQVQRFFLWFDVDEIKVDLPPSDSIYFHVGIINKKLDVGQFQTVHSCRDGVSASCGGGLLSPVLKLPTPNDDIQMLITE